MCLNRTKNLYHAIPFFLASWREHHILAAETCEMMHWRPCWYQVMPFQPWVRATPATMHISTANAISGLNRRCKIDHISVPVWSWTKKFDVPRITAQFQIRNSSIFVLTLRNYTGTKCSAQPFYPIPTRDQVEALLHPNIGVVYIDIDRETYPAHCSWYSSYAGSDRNTPLSPTIAPCTS